ncbi:chitosanase [Purpureocillium lavendulum]|uniref:Chitosanase n=1 Tax=Purpureocillium lavendulum TaxID=1247861 RepID=A0AB34FV74_9HYPO|nr:chitosanase [Purpureocillium lavendulum]
MDVPDSWPYEPPVPHPPSLRPAITSAPRQHVNAFDDEVPPPPLTVSELECATYSPLTTAPLRTRRRRNHIRHQHPYRHDGAAPVMQSQQPMESLTRKLSQQTLKPQPDQDRESSAWTTTALTAPPPVDTMQDLVRGHVDMAMDIDPIEAGDLEPLHLPLPRSVEMMRRRRMYSHRQLPSTRRGVDGAPKSIERIDSRLSSRRMMDMASKPLEAHSLLTPRETADSSTIEPQPSSRRTMDISLEVIELNSSLTPHAAADTAVEPLEPIELPPTRRAVDAAMKRIGRLKPLLPPLSTVSVADSIEPIEPLLPSRAPMKSLDALPTRPLPGTWRDYPPIEVDPKDGAGLPELEADEGFCEGADELPWLTQGGSSLAGPSRLIQSNGVLRFKRSSEAAMQCSVVVQKTARMRRRRQRKQETRSRASSTVPTPNTDRPDLPFTQLIDAGPAPPISDTRAEHHFIHSSAH